MSVGARRRIWWGGGVLAALVAAVLGAVVGGASAHGASAHHAATHSAAGPAAGPIRTGESTPVVTTSEPLSGPSAAALATGHWQRLADSPLGRRADAVISWDGRDLLEIGGDSGGEILRPFDSGAGYDPKTGRWQAIAPAPAGVDPDDAASVWTGSELFVFGSPAGTAAPSEVAGLYDPATNRWTTTSPAPLSDLAGSDATAVWTGTQVILAAADVNADGSHAGVVSYDPSTGAWVRINPPFPADHPPEGFAMVNTDHGVLLWSEWAQSVQTATGGEAGSSGVDVFRWLDGSWHRADVTWPGQNTVDQPQFTGSTVLLGDDQIWCGDLCSPPLLPDSNGREVNPATLKITAVPAGPLDAIGPQILWSGRAEIAFNSGGEVSGPHVDIRPGDIAFWDPGSRRWYSGPPVRFASTELPAVWDGSHLLALSGSGVLESYG